VLRLVVLIGAAFGVYLLFGLLDAPAHADSGVPTPFVGGLEASTATRPTVPAPPAVLNVSAVPAPRAVSSVTAAAPRAVPARKASAPPVAPMVRRVVERVAAPSSAGAGAVISSTTRAFGGLVDTVSGVVAPTVSLPLDQRLPIGAGTQSSVAELLTRPMNATAANPTTAAAVPTVTADRSPAMRSAGRAPGGVCRTRPAPDPASNLDPGPRPPPGQPERAPLGPAAAQQHSGAGAGSVKAMLPAAWVPECTDDGAVTPARACAVDRPVLHIPSPD
jgi:hypothetical protein